MGTRLFVTNLSLDMTEEALRVVLAGDGRVVQRVHMVSDAATGAGYGFACAEMGSASDARAAVVALDGTEFEGRRLTVLLARLRRLVSEARDSDAGHVRDA